MTTSDSDELITQLMAQAEKNLQRGVELVMSASQVLATDEAVEVMSCIRSLEGKDIERAEPESFMRLCDAIASAFPESNPTDDQILSFAYTPAVMRYLIASLKRNKNSNGINLPKAFLAVRPRSQPPLERTDGGEWLRTGKAAFDRAISEGKTVPDAIGIAAKFVHDEWHGAPTDVEGANKIVKRIAGTLQAEWFGEPGSTLNQEIKAPGPDKR